MSAEKIGDENNGSGGLSSLTLGQQKNVHGKNYFALNIPFKNWKRLNLPKILQNF
ncbi:tRNA-dihydrouridine synthase [Bibersteinia trehalosi USDA-ARS-USMARC-190]|uniref:tRNA-dihydrouridine synthase n=1 Tax=Bibersteinia trehalosi USDA-ARS-USMARC-190 TaxID=1263832 RepID=W0R566_BIBTR|nr:tRNA-dihydrouridine synthase [Bibersteinia trehalosi USDA-ARS-USMARC-190]